MCAMITYRGYHNGQSNPVYNVHKHVGVHYAQQNVADTLEIKNSLI